MGTGARKELTRLLKRLKSRTGLKFMRNDSVRLTPLGEWVYVGVLSVLCVGMGWAMLRAFAVVVVKVGQVLGLV